MSTVAPEALLVLSRIKRYGLGTWKPGELVISSQTDGGFVEAHAATMRRLLDSGHLATDPAGSIVVGLAGEHALSSAVVTLNETRAVVAGRRVQVVTEGWASATAAAAVRDGIVDGLRRLSTADSSSFDDVVRSLVAGREHERLRAIVGDATSGVSILPTAAHPNRVGVRAFGQ